MTRTFFAATGLRTGFVARVGLLTVVVFLAAAVAFAAVFFAAVVFLAAVFLTVVVFLAAVFLTAVAFLAVVVAMLIIPLVTHR